jgi:hypothetical protein
MTLILDQKVVLFFNGGVDPPPGDIYYFDDLLWAEKSATDLENFENGALMNWAPLDGDAALHGSYASIDNPDKTGANTTNKVGQYKKGLSQFSTLQGFIANPLDLSKKPQINMSVWAPAGATSVTMQLESATQGNKEVTRDITTPGAWEVLSFDFSNFTSITDFANALKIIFNPGVAEDGKTYYYDQVNQSEATVDPCEGSIPISTIIDDFECQRNYDWGSGGQLLTVANNPNLEGNGSVKVGLYKEQPNDPWSALCAEIPDGLDLEVFNQVELQVLSPITGPVLMKLEGGSSPAKEEWTSITEANKWVTLSRDFSSQVGKDHKRVCFFFNGGENTPQETNIYIDNVRLAHAPYNGCIMDFENPAYISEAWRYFPADNSGAFELVDNPLAVGVNTTKKVGKAVEKASGEQPWQGMFTDLESHIDLATTKRISMKVLSPQVGAITMKLERPLASGFPGSSGDNTVTNTKANEWEELVWDFSTSPQPIDNAGKYSRITLIWDINNIPAQDVVYYFDDIRIEGSTSCTPGESSSDDIILTDMTIMPNPVSDILRIDQAQDLSAIAISNVYGQVIAKIQTNGAENVSIEASQIPSGTYILMGYDDKRQLVAKSRFVKL